MCAGHEPDREWKTSQSGINLNLSLSPCEIKTPGQSHTHQGAGLQGLPNHREQKLTKIFLVNHLNTTF